MTHRLPSFFFQGKYLTILLGLMTMGFLSFGLSSSFEQTMITMDTSNSSYGPGDMVKINGHVSNSPNKLVAVQVKDPNGNTIVVRTVKTDGNGNFVLQFKVPTTATSGNFEIDASAKINGQQVTSTKSIIQAVPEFSSLAGMIIALSIIGVVVITRRFRLHFS